MPLTEEEKAKRKRDRMIKKFKEKQIGTCVGIVATDFQTMIRAEAACDPRPYVTAVVRGEVTQVKRSTGQCVCVTCGKVGPWKGDTIGGGPLDSGHFVASRAQSIVFEESNVHPQCKSCNKHLGGNEGCYTTWMRAVYGQEEIDRLRKKKKTVVQFTRAELVDMRIEFAARLKAAEERIKEA